MTKYTNIDSEVCKKFRTELNTLFEKFSKENGLKINIGTMKYTDSTIDFKVEAVIEGGKSIKFQRYEKNLDVYINYLNLLRECSLYELVGYNTQKRKAPFIVRKKIDNKMYMMDEATVKHLFKKAA